jgi:hypothetical protein
MRSSGPTSNCSTSLAVIQAFASSSPMATRSSPSDLPRARARRHESMARFAYEDQSDRSPKRSRRAHPASQRSRGRSLITVGLSRARSVIDGGQDGPYRDSVFRPSLSVRQHHDSVAVEDEVPAELAPVLTAMQIGDASMKKGLGVEPNDIGVSVDAQKRRPSESKASVRGPLRIEGDHKREMEPALKPNGSFSGLEGDNDNDGICLLETVHPFGHLHEMAFAKQSPDVAQEREENGTVAE